MNRASRRKKEARERRARKKEARERRAKEAKEYERMDDMCGESLAWAILVDNKWKIYGCPPYASHAKCIGIYTNKDDAANAVNELGYRVRTIDPTAWDDEEKRVLDLDEWEPHSVEEWNKFMEKEIAKLSNAEWHELMQQSGSYSQKVRYSDTIYFSPI